MKSKFAHRYFSSSSHFVAQERSGSGLNPEFDVGEDKCSILIVRRGPLDYSKFVMLNSK